MPDTAAEPRRWVILTFFENAVEKAEEEIKELKALGLWVRDATGPGDREDPSKGTPVQSQLGGIPEPAPAPAQPATPPAAAPAVPAPPAVPPAVVKTDK